MKSSLVLGISTASRTSSIWFSAWGFPSLLYKKPGLTLAKLNCLLTRPTLQVTNSCLASARFGKRKAVAKLVCITSSAPE